MRQILCVTLVLLAAAMACSPFGGADDDTVQTAIAQTNEAAAEFQVAVDTAVAGTAAAVPDTPMPPTTAPPTEPPPPTEAPPQPEPAAGPALIVLYNDSYYDICHLYLTPVAGGVEEDLLGLENMIPGGYSSTLFDIPPGDYDLRVESCEGEMVAEEYGVSLRGKTPWAIPGPIGESGISVEEGVPLTLVNDTPVDVCLVWAGPPESEWSAEVLDQDTLPAGGSLTVTLPPGMWALKALDCDGNQVGYEAAYDITSGTEWHIGP